MARRCAVCDHPKRDEIDAWLIEGRDTFAFGNQRWQVSPSSLSRHKKNHLPARLRAAYADREGAVSQSLLSRVETLIAQTEGMLNSSQADGRVTVALQAVKELRGLLSLLGQVTGDVDKRPVVNLVVSPEWQTMRGALLVVLEPYPEARAAVAGRLLELEAAT